MDEKSEDDRGQEAYSLSETERMGCGGGWSVFLVFIIFCPSLLAPSPVSINTLFKKQPVWGVSINSSPLLSPSNCPGASFCSKSSEHFSVFSVALLLCPFMRLASLTLPCPAFDHRPLHFLSELWVFLFLLACLHSTAFCSHSQLSSLLLSCGSCVPW